MLASPVRFSIDAIAPSTRSQAVRELSAVESSKTKRTYGTIAVSPLMTMPRRGLEPPRDITPTKDLNLKTACFVSIPPEHNTNIKLGHDGTYGERLRKTGLC